MKKAIQILQRNKVLIENRIGFDEQDLKDITEIDQALQLLQTGVIKSVCGNCERKQLYIKKQCYCGYCGDRLKT